MAPRTPPDLRSREVRRSHTRTRMDTNTGPCPDAGPRQPSRAGLFVILAALLTCQLAFPFLSSIGSYAGFSLIDMVYRFVFSSMTWIVVVGIVQAVKRRPIPSFIPAAAMSVASSVFDLVLVVAYAGGHTFLSAVTNASFFLISLIEVCLFMIAGWMSCTRLRGRPGSPPISVLLSSGAAQFLLVLAAGRLVNAPVLLLMSGVGAPFDQYGADMRLGYGLYWYANSQPVGGAVPFGVGLAILIVVGLAAAGAVVSAGRVTGHTRGGIRCGFGGLLAALPVRYDPDFSCRVAQPWRLVRGSGVCGAARDRGCAHDRHVLGGAGAERPRMVRRPTMVFVLSIPPSRRG